MFRAPSLAVLAITLGFASQSEARQKYAPDLSSSSRTEKVIIYPSFQPVSSVSKLIWSRYTPMINELGASVRAIVSTMRPTGLFSPEAEQGLQLTALDPLARAAVLALHEQIDELEDRATREINEECALQAAPIFAKLSQSIFELGGTVSATTSCYLSISATMTASAAITIAKREDVFYVDLDRNTAEELSVSGASVGVQSFWNISVDGGVYDGGILDSGVYHLHPNLVGHPFQSQNGDSYTSTHGTQMAGIMASNHATDRGLSFGMDTLSAAYASGTESISMTGMNWLINTATERAENINYSYGNGTANSNDYRQIDQFFDAVVHSFNVMVSKSTGNGGFGSGAPTITHPAPAYNLMAVANMNDLGTVSRTDDVIATSSSRGPTLAGRKKPDIAAPGTNINTTTPSNGFASVTGTSPAAPHVGASVILLRDFGLTDVRACKAVLINTADAKDDRGTSTTADDVYVAGSLWNRRYGWGYLDLAEAAINATDVFLHTINTPSSNRQFKFYKGTMFAHEKATLVWHRHVGSNGSSYPTQIESLSNLDLFAYKSLNGALVSSSASTIDNVEQVGISEDGEFVLKVLAATAFDPQVPIETYALATEENFETAIPPSFSIDISVPKKAKKNGAFRIKVIVKNMGEVASHLTMVSFSASGFGGTGNVNLGSIPAGGSKTAEFHAIAPGTTGERELSFQVTSNSYGESFTAAASQSILIGG